MSALREASQLAVEVLRQWVIPRAGVGTVHYKKALELLRGALAKPDDKAQPVVGAFLNKYGGVTLCQNGKEHLGPDFAGRLYIAPQPQAEQVAELSDEQINAVLSSTAPEWWDVPMDATMTFARAVIAADRAARGDAA